jgi:hypothetical protein
MRFVAPERAKGALKSLNGSLSRKKYLDTVPRDPTTVIS